MNNQHSGSQPDSVYDGAQVPEENLSHEALLQNLRDVNRGLRAIDRGICVVDLPTVPEHLQLGTSQAIRILCKEHQEKLRHLNALRSEVLEAQRQLEEKRKELTTVKTRLERKKKHMQNLLNKNVDKDHPHYPELQQLRNDSAMDENKIIKRESELAALKERLQPFISEKEQQTAKIVSVLNEKIVTTRKLCKQLIDAERMKSSGQHSTAHMRVINQEPKPPVQPKPPQLPKAPPKPPKRMVNAIAENLVKAQKSSGNVWRLPDVDESPETGDSASSMTLVPVHGSEAFGFTPPKRETPSDVPKSMEEVLMLWGEHAFAGIKTGEDLLMRHLYIACWDYRILRHYERYAQELREQKHVKIDVQHTLNTTLQEWMQRVLDAFHSEQSSLVRARRVQEYFALWRIQTGKAPTLVQFRNLNATETREYYNLLLECGPYNDSFGCATARVDTTDSPAVAEAFFQSHEFQKHIGELHEALMRCAALTKKAQKVPVDETVVARAVQQRMDATKLRQRKRLEVTLNDKRNFFCNIIHGVGLDLVQKINSAKTVCERGELSIGFGCLKDIFREHMLKTE